MGKGRDACTCERFVSSSFSALLSSPARRRRCRSAATASHALRFRLRPPNAGLSRHAAHLPQSTSFLRRAVDTRVESSAARPMSPERRDAHARVGRALIVRARLARACSRSASSKASLDNLSQLEFCDDTSRTPKPLPERLGPDALAKPQALSS